MLGDIDHIETAAVRTAVRDIQNSLFPGRNPDFLDLAFGWLEDAFAGRYPGYQSIDARYHDLNHTLQVTYCFAHLLEGYKLSGAEPTLTPRAFELALLAMLLHDTGYLKKEGDTDGTGAKYTLVHVHRSSEFAAEFMSRHGFPPAEIEAVQNMIRCTGVNTDLQAIAFQDELEKTLGYGLATADLVGQMAASDYVTRLDILYQEFEESNRYNGLQGRPGTYRDAEDLRQKTPVFWMNYVLPRITHDLKGMYRYLARPAPTGRNEYLERIEAHITRLRADDELANASPGQRPSP